MPEEMSQPKPEEQKKGMGWIIWLAIMIVILIILFLLKSCIKPTATTNTNTTANTSTVNENTNNSSENRNTNTKAAGTSEITAAEDGPVARWEFNGSGQDTTGNGHTATALGSAKFDGTLDGIDDALTVKNSPKLNPTTAITVSAWWDAIDFRGSGNNGLVDKGFTSHDAPHYQYHLGVTGTQYQSGGHFDFWVALDGTSVQTGGVNYTVGKRYHLVGTYDGSTVNLFVDGAKVKSVPGTGSMNDYGKDLAIASFSNLQRVSTDFLPGKIDDVAIWDRALTEAEVKALYTAGPK